MAAQPPPPTRTASVGPPSAGGMNAQQAATPGAGQNPQQNLNQIVSEANKPTHFSFHRNLFGEYGNHESELGMRGICADFEDPDASATDSLLRVRGKSSPNELRANAYIVTSDIGL